MQESRHNVYMAFALGLMASAIMFLIMDRQEPNVPPNSMAFAPPMFYGYQQIPPQMQTGMGVGTTTVSPAHSKITPTESAADTESQTAITVELRDASGMPVVGHMVQLISSAASGTITPPQALSDASGNAIFSVSSDISGKATYTAYDLTSGVVLPQQAVLAYFDSYVDLFSNSVGNSSGDANTFAFKDVPGAIGVGDSVSFTLVAEDSAGKKNPQYLGTVQFSVLSDNESYVILPGDYTFTAQDQGSHTFSLALSFLKPGVYNIEARDSAAPDIAGAMTFTVSASGSSASSGSLKVNNPISGTYSNAIQVISGTAPAGASLKVFDNQLAIGSAVADQSGAFSFTTSPLTEGAHSIYVAEINAVGTVVASSAPVAITIDTSVPDITKVTIEPSSTVGPGLPVVVKITASEVLSQAAVVVNESVHELVHVDGVNYETSFVAPSVAGQYPLSVIIVDELGNESRIDNAATLTVGAQTGSGAVPADVSGLTAKPEDHRVILNWNPVNDPAVTHYRVYYGLSPSALTEAVDTFTTATTWYIPNLKNGQEYYFAVVAVRDKGATISAHFSNIVNATPNPQVTTPPSPEITAGFGGGEAIDDMTGDVSDSGPAVWVLLLLSLAGGALYVRLRSTAAHSFDSI